MRKRRTLELEGPEPAVPANVDACPPTDASSFTVKGDALVTDAQPPKSSLPWIAHCGLSCSDPGMFHTRSRWTDQAASPKRPQEELIMVRRNPGGGHDCAHFSASSRSSFSPSGLDQSSHPCSNGLKLAVRLLHDDTNVSLPHSLLLVVEFSDVGLVFW